MNAQPRFVTNLDGMDIQFVHREGSGARPTPLLIAHGWPYSFHSFSKLIDPLTRPEQHGGGQDDAFSVVVPSFPGSDFSDRPARPLGPKAIALLFDQLMAKLGYDRYLVHGGDWGAHITSLLGFHRPDRVIGIHSTALCIREAGAEQLSGQTPADAGAGEREFAARELEIWQREGAYSQVQATKPAKLGYSMIDSPVGTAAWIVEAFHAWSDRRDRRFEDLFSFDELITEIMLYLVTDAFPTSTWIYGAKSSEEKTLPAGERVEVPTALAAFRDPVFPMPPRDMAERSHNIMQYSIMPRGGHFPFYEEPSLLLDDLRKFRRAVT